MVFGVVVGCFGVGLACDNSVAYMDVVLNWLGVCGLGVVMFELILLLRVGWGWCLVGWIGLVVGVLVGCLTWRGFLVLDVRYVELLLLAFMIVWVAVVLFCSLLVACGLVVDFVLLGCLGYVYCF